ncbi:Sulfate transport system permease protein CysW [Frondihabitans sp. 762G35]|uniref:ABC transporter permease n=1 Tax=Frondihabitans sp. 762G35 TaxID=1446794 RepID=UPI000D211CF9|nr:iron ABC transporter permease [Frondihabitans sp. 762G35]ARC58387.1 Sulfate transport system permease protein CysW [Frondihabitans sp. 762G35]
MTALTAGRRRAPTGLLVTVGVVVLVTLIPIGFVVSTAIQTGWATLGPLIFRPRVGELLLNSIGLLLLGVPACIAIGVGGAFLVERTTLPGRRVFTILLAAPLAVPAFVSSYGWASAVPSISGLSGGLLITTLAYYPLVYLPAVATLRRLDPALEETARSLGRGSWSVFFSVILPQLRLAIWGGGLVVALHLLAEYGAFALIRFDTFTTAIVVQFQSTFAGPAASALGGVLATLCLVLLVGEAGTRGRARYSRVGSGSAHPATRIRLGWAAVPSVLLLVGLGVLALGVPLVSLGHWLSVGSPWSDPDLLTTFGQTAFLAVGGAVLTVVLALPLAWLSVRFPTRISRVLEGSSYLASSLPAIIVALALVTVTIRLVPSLYQTYFTVFLAYSLVFLPRALVTLRSGIAQAPVLHEEIARSLGKSPLVARLRVTAPAVWPSIAAAAALVALGAANELTATLLLAPTGTRTLSTQFWSDSTSLNYSGAAPYALLLIALSIPAVAILFTQTRRTAKA